ncbi:uncharacterized protein LOC130654402 isoform X1 [Hydractinia symbiolongicarpus]|uniref:uncharacterized protein LOC130654402 isoform X1 n=1 Tax=Hydractinia symbiolongicarpus TaxID=13093 RepID=UPI00254ACE71|nr:uncharacterized protein LOC130654402 isoform X1 [Hydractinia symbiolongicarpus]
MDSGYILSKKMSSDEINSGEKLANGYPFRDDIINFTLKYKEKKFYFEFPVLIDRSFLLREIKERTRVRGSFCLRWKTGEVKGDLNKTKEEQKEKKGPFKKTADVCLHSTNITTLTLRRFCGKTLHIVNVDRSSAGEDPTWEHFSHDPVLEYKRKMIRERFTPFDCPP